MQFLVAKGFITDKTNAGYGHLPALIDDELHINGILIRMLQGEFTPGRIIALAPVESVDPLDRIIELGRIQDGIDLNIGGIPHIFFFDFVKPGKGDRLDERLFPASER